MIETIQSGLTAAALFMCAVLIVSLVAFSAAPLVRDAWRKWRKRGSAAVAIGGIAIATIYGGGKPHVVPHAGADAGITLLAIEAEYTNEVTVVEVKYTAGDVTTATPVSVRNAESEQWRELEKVGATITPGQTNVLAFTVAEDVAAYRYWWVGVDLPAVIVESQGITITNFVATSKSVRIDWTCDDPKATVFSIQRKRKKPAGIPYDAEVEYIATTAQSSGPSGNRSFIDTGVVLQEVDGHLHQFKVIWRATNRGLWGWFSQTLPSGTWLGSIVGSDSGVYFGTYHNKYSFSTMTDYADYIVDSTRGLSVNGTFVYSAIVSLSDITNLRGRTLPFFICYDIRTNISYSKIYNCRYAMVQIEVDGVLVRDMIPVRVGTVGYLYDHVTCRLFGNAGTGAFAYGSDTLSYDWETVDTTSANTYTFSGFTVGEDWEWRVTSTYTEGEP